MFILLTFSELFELLVVCVTRGRSDSVFNLSLIFSLQKDLQGEGEAVVAPVVVGCLQLHLPTSLFALNLRVPTEFKSSRG